MMLHQTAPLHLFVSHDGNLYDTRNPTWSTFQPLRRNFMGHKRVVDSVADFKSSVRAGGCTWPGGYAVAFLCDDGGTLCHTCARHNAKTIIDSIANNHRDGWRVVGCLSAGDFDEPEICDHCNSEIS